MELLDAVERTVRRHRMIPDGAAVVVAVSGGADSLVLLDTLHRLAPAHDWRLHVATFDHRWRPESAADVESVLEHCRRIGVPVTCGAAAPHLGSSEASARGQRHAFLGSVAVADGARLIAVGHTADDRVETLLLNLFRGAGTTGLGAMAPRADHVVRPLIELRREAVRAYAVEQGLPVREDPTNRDPAHERNRVRHELLPLLEAFQPGVTEVLLRSAEVCGAERDVLAAYATRLLKDRQVDPEPASFLPGMGALVVDVSGWSQEVAGKRWLLLREALRWLGGSLTDVGLAQTEQLDALASGRPDAEPLQVKELLASRWGDRLVLLPSRAQVGPWGPVELAVPGATNIAPAGVTIYVTFEEPQTGTNVRLGRAQVGHLTVRSRRPGDCLRPVGLDGTKTVQDLMVDRKIPRVARDRVPLLCSDEAVAWVPGSPPDQRFLGPEALYVAVGFGEVP